MPLPEGYLPREGDIIVIHAKVKHDLEPGETTVFIRLKSYGTDSVDLANVVGLHCRHWDAGAKVFREREGVGEVIAVCDDQVWVKFPLFNVPITCHANTLKLAPEEVEQTPELPPAPTAASKEDDDVQF